MNFKTKEKYVEYWKNKLDLIKCKMECAISTQTTQIVKLNISDFQELGDRNSYSFSLKYSDGKVCNNIGGSAVARDLAKVFENSTAAKMLLKEGNFSFRFRNSGDLIIKTEL